jgi:hypothetical protein
MSRLVTALKWCLASGRYEAAVRRDQQAYERQLVGADEFTSMLRFVDRD